MRFWRPFGITLLARLVGRASDARIERWFGSSAIQRAMFTAMAAGFDPHAVEGFRGLLVYELQRPAIGRSPTRWTIEVADGHAAARPGGADDPALTIRYGLADFVRVAAGLIDPAVPLLNDRAAVSGDLALAARLPEMFRAPRPR